MNRSDQVHHSDEDKEEGEQPPRPFEIERVATNRSAQCKDEADKDNAHDDECERCYCLEEPQQPLLHAYQCPRFA